MGVEIDRMLFSVSSGGLGVENAARRPHPPPTPTNRAGKTASPDEGAPATVWTPQGAGRRLHPQHPTGRAARAARAERRSDRPIAFIAFGGEIVSADMPDKARDGPARCDERWAR